MVSYSRINALKNIPRRKNIPFKCYENFQDVNSLFMIKTANHSLLGNHIISDQNFA